MRQPLLIIMLTASLSGCAVGLGSSNSQPTAVPRPSAGVSSARPTPTPTRAQSSTDNSTIKSFSCAVVPIVDELGRVSGRYDDAHNAVAAQLVDAARLDMDDAVTLARKARSQLGGLRPPGTVARYHQLLLRAASSFLGGGTALRRDYASANLSSAARDGKTFLAGRTFLEHAELERQRISRRVALPDESSPQCTAAYLREFLKRTRVTATPRPTSTAAPAAPTATPTRTPRPRPTRHPTIHRTPTHPALSAAARAYIDSERKVIESLNSANVYLSTAYTVRLRGRGAQASALVDSAVLRLDQASRISARVHAPPSGVTDVRQEIRASLAAAYVAARKIRLSIIDQAGGSTGQARRDIVAAYTSLKLSLKNSSQAREALHTQSS